MKDEDSYQRCQQCQLPRVVLVFVKKYLGEDKDWGHQYHEQWICISCLTETKGKD